MQEEQEQEQEQELASVQEEQEQEQKQEAPRFLSNEDHAARPPPQQEWMLSFAGDDHEDGEGFLPTRPDTPLVDGFPHMSLAEDGGHGHHAPNPPPTPPPHPFDDVVVAASFSPSSSSSMSSSAMMSSSSSSPHHYPHPHAHAHTHMWEKDFEALDYYLSEVGGNIQDGTRWKTLVNFLWGTWDGAHPIPWCRYASSGGQRRFFVCMMQGWGWSHTQFFTHIAKAVCSLFAGENVPEPIVPV